MRGVHMNSQPITRMRYWVKVLKLQVSVPSLVHANIMFLTQFPKQSSLQWCWCALPYKHTEHKEVSMKDKEAAEIYTVQGSLPFGSIKFILQSKKLWRTFYKEKECSSYVGPSGEKVYVHRHRLWKNLVILSASPVEWFSIQIVQA